MPIVVQDSGFNFLPAKKKNYYIDQADVLGDTSNTPNSYYGWYSGYHWRFSVIIRPGVVLGLGWENDVKEIGGQKVGYSGFSIVPYFGLDVHLAIFSFRLSNEGIGSGLNFRFGRFL